MKVSVGITAGLPDKAEGATLFPARKLIPMEPGSAGSIKELRNAANGATTLTFNAQKAAVFLTLLILPDHLDNAPIPGRIFALSTTADNKPALLLSQNYVFIFQASALDLRSFLPRLRS